MFPAHVDYHRPASVDEALKLLHDSGDLKSVFLAGGQSLIPALKARQLKPAQLIDLQNIAELKGIQKEVTHIEIGPMVRYCEIETAEILCPAYAALQDAAKHIGDRQVRNQGTLGGALSWNQLRSCISPVCVALDARIILRDTSGLNRILNAESFLQVANTTARQHNEMIVAVHFPASVSQSGSAYKKWSVTTDGPAIVNMSVAIEVNTSGACQSARIAIGTLPSGPRRCGFAETMLIGTTEEDEERISDTLDAIVNDVRFFSEHAADAKYKSLLLKKMGRDVIKTAFQRAKGLAQ